MKYRTSLPRPHISAPARDTHPAAPRRPETSQNKKPDVATNTRSRVDSEPLIDLSETETRLQRMQDTIGAVALVGLSVGQHALIKVKKVPYGPLFSGVKKRIHHVWRALLAANRRTKIVSVTALVILIAGINYGLSTQSGQSSILSDNSQTTETRVGSETPQHNTILPPGKSIDDLGGWARVSPPDRNPVFAYADTLDGEQISVSQQPLPDTFSNNPAEDVQSVAYEFNAKERVVAKDGTVFYIGTSSKGPQSVIFIKKDLLILVKSPAKIDNKSWSDYIASLQ